MRVPRFVVRLMRSSLCVIAIAAAAPSRATEITLYVSPTGKDTYNGLSLTAPLATLSEANTRILAKSFPKGATVLVHVLPGIYRGQLIRWALSDDYEVIIRGAGWPVFTGADLGATAGNQTTFMDIRRGTLSQRAVGKLTIRGLLIEHYLEAFWIRGNTVAYGWSPSGVVIENNRIQKIGAAHSKIIPMNSRRPSRGAILLYGAREVVIRGNEFVDITNDAGFPKSYATYEGLHAIYAMHFSSGAVIEGNGFTRVFARGIIKFRNFSNFGRVIGNRFQDDTTLLQDSYCDVTLPACQALSWIDCPSYGIVFAGNTVRHYRGEGKHRPTIEIQNHSANNGYCQSDKFWDDSQLRRDDPLNVVGSARRIYTE